MLNIFKNKKGFSILEAVVAFYLITMGMVGLLSLVTFSIKTQYITKNMVTGSQLAQEGIELVRNIRDTNWLKHDDWIDGDGFDSDTDILQDDNYIIDYTGSIDDFVTTNNEAGTRLYLDGNGFYVHDSVPPNKPTAFYRIIEVNEIVLDEQLNVTSRVRWSAGGQNHEYVAETELYNWAF
ncbi:hypothetical protein DRH27_02760 [Candidatus Falkowbacteria bacterium]|nr:MAG: hypothetical protein DRH27_02760 [Candidatus Falkowbacteria bacterium]